VTWTNGLLVVAPSLYVLAFSMASVTSVARSMHVVARLQKESPPPPRRGWAGGVGGGFLSASRSGIDA
jgi:hypothetical protein